VTRLVVAVLVLSAVYLLTLASLDPVDLVVGVVLALIVVALFAPELLRRGGPTPGNMLRRLIATPWMLVGLIRNIVTGTISVALIVVGLRPLRQPGIVAIPFGERTRLGIIVSALETTLSPGTYLVDIDWQKHVMLIHAIDASDPDHVRAEHEEFYQRFQKGVFP